MSAMMAIETMGKPGLALDIPKNQSFDQWVEMGRSLCEGQRVVNWWIGDWWAAGSHRYGERAKVAAEGIFGREFQSLMDMASVCRSFETSRRREALSFTHHREVASLPPADADALLDVAERDGLPRNKLRTMARLRKIDLGLLQPHDVGDDDDATKAAKKVQYIWNASPEDVREYIYQAVKDAAAHGFRDLDV